MRQLFQKRASKEDRTGEGRGNLKIPPTKLGSAVVVLSLPSPTKKNPTSQVT